MHLKDEIEKAIGAHSLWKIRLNAAINTGVSEFSPEKVSTDNQCDFGRWLYGETISAAEKAGPCYQSVRQHHTEFHKVAADVLKLALSGKKDEAHKLVGLGGRFASLSAELTTAMMAWAKSR